MTASHSYTILSLAPSPVRLRRRSATAERGHGRACLFCVVLLFAPPEWSVVYSSGQINALFSICPHRLAMPLQRPSLHSQPHIWRSRRPSLCEATQPRKYADAITKPAIVVRQPCAILPSSFERFEPFARSPSCARLRALAGGRGSKIVLCACPLGYSQPARMNVMPGIVWERLDPVTTSRLGIDLIRQELDGENWTMPVRKKSALRESNSTFG